MPILEKKNFNTETMLITSLFLEGENVYWVECHSIWRYPSWRKTVKLTELDVTDSET